jgi:ABC-type multidrug transport system ATPase subunit
MSHLRRLCDMGIVLGGGRLQAFDTVDEAIRCYQASIGVSDADLEKETRRAERRMARDEARFGAAGRAPVTFDGRDH